MFFIFALEINTFGMTAFCDEIFDITLFANIIVESVSVNRFPNLRKVVSGIFSEIRKWNMILLELIIS